VFETSEAAAAARGESLNCRTAPLTPPAPSASAWARYQFYANAGKLYYALERDAEADQAWEQARAIFDDDSSLHLDIGQLRHAQGRLPEAEREFRQAIRLRPTPTAYYALADLLAQERRPFEAVEYFHESAMRDARPHEAWAAMGRSAMEAQRPAQALDCADRALAANPYRGEAASVGRGFLARTQALRGAALMALGRAPQAVEALEQAVRVSSDPRFTLGLRLDLCEAYRLAGRAADARHELEMARQGGAQGPAVEQIEKELAAAPIRPAAK
jgi:tetratricopeptide (TPR) repeat protein